MRTKIVAGNWKMNKDRSNTLSLVKELKEKLRPTTTRIMIAPTFVNLNEARKAVENSAVEVIAQNMHYADSGAFTGEISATMLQDIGVNCVILGHSERRSIFQEGDELLKRKVSTAIDRDMEVIFCFGELLNERKESRHFEVVREQLNAVLFHLSEADWAKIVLAYEPVWAIGTGETATPDQAQEMHAFIRKVIAENYSDALAQSVPILYGGSVKPNNAGEIFAKPDVDGGLIGGASLVADDFVAIVEACQ